MSLRTLFLDVYVLYDAYLEELAPTVIGLIVCCPSSVLIVLLLFEILHRARPCDSSEPLSSEFSLDKFVSSF